MCRSGRTGWLFTDSAACYVGADLGLRQCSCPVTTCVETVSGYECQLTTSVLILSGFLVAIWILSGCVYIYLTHYITSLEQEARLAREASIGRNYYYDKLFGTGSPASAAVPILPTEQSSLLSK